MTGASNMWSAREDRVLVEHYGLLGTERCAKMLPSRSRAAINCRVRLLKLHKSDCRWSTLEIDRLRSLWPFAPWPELIQEFPNRTKMAIGRAAANLRVKRHPEANAITKKNCDPVFVLLRRRREELRLSRYQLAEVMGHHCVKLAKWELGDQLPRWRAFRDWCDALGVVIAVLPKAEQRELRRAA